MVSNKNKKNGKRRPYNLKARARRQEQVHHRITLAALHLHETVGPAKTTMKAIAEIAGVRRATVYNHFPTELDLIDACSSHWFVENPPPDPGSWAETQNPADRTERALREIYRYYGQGRKMLENVLRDAAVVPAMDEIRRRKWVPFLENIVEQLAEGWESYRSGQSKSGSADSGSVLTAETKERLRASLRVALDFFNWKILTDSGLSNDAAAKLAAGWVKASQRRADFGGRRP